MVVFNHNMPVRFVKRFSSRKAHSAADWLVTAEKEAEAAELVLTDASVGLRKVQENSMEGCGVVVEVDMKKLRKPLEVVKHEASQRPFHDWK